MHFYVPRKSTCRNVGRAGKASEHLMKNEKPGPQRSRAFSCASRTESGCGPRQSRIHLNVAAETQVLAQDGWLEGVSRGGEAKIPGFCKLDLLGSEGRAAGGHAGDSGDELHP